MQKLQKRKSQLVVILVLAIVLVPSVYFTLRQTHILQFASTVQSLEPENGVASGTVQTLTDTTASGGKYVQLNTPTTDPSGEPMPAGDLPGWHQIFAEDFANDAAAGQFKTVYASRFTNYGDGWIGTDKTLARRCTPKVVFAAGGVMTYDLHQETLQSTDICSGGTSGTYWLNAVEQPAINGQTIKQLYGKYTIRFRVRGTLPGQYMVPLLWPTSEVWPRDGEIDFPEGHLEGNICAFLHHQDATVGSDQEAFCPGAAFSSGWHTASTEWSSGSATFILDGTIIGHSTTRVPNTTMRYVLQSETCIGGISDCPAGGTRADIDFDWVVEYSKI